MQNYLTRMLRRYIIICISGNIERTNIKEKKQQNKDTIIIWWSGIFCNLEWVTFSNSIQT